MSGTRSEPPDISIRDGRCRVWTDFTLHDLKSVHGGCYGDLGFNTYTVFPAARALGMPFPLAIAATGMIVDGVFDAFPTLRVGFLEGGTAWIPLVIDRLERELEYGGLRIKRRPAEYFRSDNLFVGCEGNEKALAYAIERVGPQPFMFASDFPHEITLDNCREEIDEILERSDLKDEHKAAILGDNARRFYKIWRANHDSVGVGSRLRILFS
jgi:uncharacterized protein